MMKAPSQRIRTLIGLLLFCFVLLGTGPLFAKRNEILCEVKFTGATAADRDAGVWIDGMYVGYLEELRGKKKSC